MWWMKHVPNGREERKTTKDWDPMTHEETARVGTQGPMKKEHGEKQADKYEVFAEGSEECQNNPV